MMLRWPFESFTTINEQFNNPPLKQFAVKVRRRAGNHRLGVYI